jgi:cytochrome c1
MSYCSSCHSLQYARYERTANDLGIPNDVILDSVIFNEHQIGDLMENSMSTDNAKNWFGAAPPDLTLIGRVRSLTDRRVTQLRLTATGEAATEGIPEVVARVNNDYLQGFSREEFEELNALLARMRANGRSLEQPDGDAPGEGGT